MTILCLVLAVGVAALCEAAPPCELHGILPGGDPVESHLIAASVARTREVLADSLQAAGFLLFTVGERSVEGERADERIRALGLPGGDEAVRATFTAATGGEVGTQVRVETVRRGNKSGAPKHTWSAGIMEHAVCLADLLSPDDPQHRPAVSLPDGPEIRISDSTLVEVRARHFVFNADMKPGQNLTFETSEPLIVNGSNVVPAGSLVLATMDSTDVKGFGKGAKGRLIFRYLTLQDGTRLLLRGGVDETGKSVGKGALTTATVVLGLGAAAAVTGTGFAIPAGTLFRAEIDGDQQFRVKWPQAPTPDQK
jgi:hypothetical protein